MRSGTRLSERWFNRALWLVALGFAGCLIGLGSLVVGDLPEVERSFTLDQFLDRPKADGTATALAEIRRERDDNGRRTAEAQLALDAARAASAAAQDTFANWLKTRDATQRVDQDPGLIARTEKLDELKAAERAIEEQLATLAKTDLESSGREVVQMRADDELRADAQARLDAATSRQELRVEEARPKEERRNEIVTDEALMRLAKKVCPGCERPIDLADGKTNFCPHCGIGVYERCPACSERKSAFDRFCYSCGHHAEHAVSVPA